mmetsp:Transcript_11703/g.20086  ORF Transcript_11703/g.20086 Transcript_11703/m.20086 type:complete len:132 (-) Transcript_11703:1237-1632(-)
MASYLRNLFRVAKGTPHESLPNFRIFLKLRPPPDVDQRMLLPDDTFETKTLIFQTIPRATRCEIKRYLEAVYNLDILKVNTLNVLGKRLSVSGLNGERYYKRTKDYKKAYVLLRTPVRLPVRPRPHSEFVD